MNIRIEGLKKTFGNQQVLNIEEMEIGNGITCIMGQNGSGKSTLLNILSGQLDYEEGLIRYDNRFYDKSLAGSITLVQQKPYLFNRSVYDNIAYPLKIRGCSHTVIQEKVNIMMDRLLIKELKSKYAVSLSGGEAQKVALARAMIFEPYLLMLDEPTSNIDEETMALIENIILNYVDNKKTVIMVTHNQNQARKLTNCIIRLA